jgi:hypothetical protein
MVDGELTPEERRALDAWKVDGGPDVSERVLAQLEEKPRRPFWIGVAVTAVMAAAVIGSVFIRRAPSAATHVAERRLTRTIAGRAVAVMEKGARLSYRAGAAIEVDQTAGDVFYRVEPGDPFLIRTPAGTVTVLGTCLRVEVRDMDAKVAGAIGGAAGALLSSAVLVTVYEGKVETSSSEGSVVVEAGERAELAPGRAPVKRQGGRGEDHREVEAAPRDEELDRLAPAELPELVLSLSKQKRALEQEVAGLRAELSKAKGEKRHVPMYDIPQEELVQMAESCELRWDVPGIGGQPQALEPEDLEKLEASGDEGEVIDRLMAESQAHLLEEVKRAYTAITGDENTGSMAGEAMFAEIRDKTTKAEMKRLYQTLARERAGLQPRPPEGSPMTPVERLYRVLTSEGDRLEQAMAAELGAEVARRARDLHQGWGDRFKSSHGCP